MNIDPYRFFFPLGWLYAICGTAVWILYHARTLIDLPYPGVLHVSWMGGGFFLAFVAGFLMTAVPKFTGSHLRASVAEMATLFVFLSSPLLGVLPETLTYILHAASFAFLILFFARRYRARRHNVPDFFLLIPFGLGLGLVGSLCLAHGDLMSGRILAFQAPMLCLMLGVGGKMIPAFLGWGGEPFRIAKPGAAWGVRVQVALVTVSFALEALTLHPAARVLRAIAVVWIGFGTWQMHRRPPHRTRLTLVLRVSLGFTVAGVCLHALWPALGVHGLHLLFIGGAGLMILGVGTRVSLAHGGHGLGLERSSRALQVAAWLLPIAAITRATAPWGGSYEGHLAYAAVLWNIALIAWGIALLPKIFRCHHERSL